MKYRKKPIVIEAMQFKIKEVHDDYDVGCLRSAIKINEWCSGADVAHYDETAATAAYITIGTLEGNMIAKPGDWIIKGVKGEFYPCKPDIFEATYEKVDD